MELGARMIELRAARGWTQKELAGRSHLPQATMSRIESGAVKHPSTRTLEALAKAFGIPLDVLIAPRDLSTAEILAEVATDERSAKVLRVFSGLPDKGRGEFEDMAAWLEQKYKKPADEEPEAG